MRKIDLRFMRLVFLDCVMPRPDQRPSQWCVENLEFDESSNHGPFKLDGCEYIADIVDDWGNPLVSDEVLVFGSQARKTGSLMGGACWALKNDPCGMLWVMPSIQLARGFSRKRFMKMIRKSKPLSELLPTGARRHEFSTLEMLLGASAINFVGSNSAANLSSNPCRRVVMDEVDKFDGGGRGEADAVNLAEQRTKDQVNPQRWKTSTPTITSGLIWQEFLKGNQMRYFVPCPHCSELVVFAWSEDYTALTKAGKEAYVHWDESAKGEDGAWDFQRVRSSAHAECPHCRGKIEDYQKKAMVKAGRWIATNPTAPAGFISRHLPSLYASSEETSFGALAVKFLQALKSSTGLQGFINGDLAEPYQYQDKLKTVQIVINLGLKKNREGIPDRTVRLGAGDKQKGEQSKGELPHWWHVICDVKVEPQKVRVRLVSEGKMLTDANLVNVFREHEVLPSAVILDSGWDTNNVYALCMENGFYALKAEGKDQLFSGHEDGGKKIYAPPKPLHTMLTNAAPKHNYVMNRGVWVPDPMEPMFIHVAKYPLMEFWNWMRTAPHISIEIPEDVSPDFHSHMSAWVVETETKKKTNELIRHWRQCKDRDDLYQCMCYIALMMLDAGLVDHSPIGGQAK